MAFRVIFMGTPAFSVPVLRALADAGHAIACVYTQPPRPSSAKPNGWASTSARRYR